MSTYIINASYQDELYHHGIKGQRWGIRRYQNEDGTLTDEGKKRYGTVDPEKVSLKTIKQERENLLTELSEESWNEDKDKIKELKKKAFELAKKYDFDQDDGGGGSTIEDQKAGAEYMKIWDEIDKIERSYESSGEKYLKIKKEVNDFLTKIYGTKRMNDLKTAENRKRIAIGAGLVTAAIGIFGGAVATPFIIDQILK